MSRNVSFTRKTPSPRSSPRRSALPDAQDSRGVVDASPSPKTAARNRNVDTNSRVLGGSGHTSAQTQTLEELIFEGYSEDLRKDERLAEVLEDHKQSKYAEELRELGLRAFKADRGDEEAEALLNRSIGVYNGNLEAWALRAEIRLVAGSHLEAIIDCDHALSLSKKTFVSPLGLAKVYMTKGEAQLAMGRTQKATETLLQAACYFPAHAHVRALLDQARAQIKHNADTEVAATFRENGDEFWAKQDYPRAVAAYNMALKHNVVDAALYSHRAKCFEYLKEWEKALQDCNRVIALEACSAEEYSCKVRMHLILGEVEAAVDAVKVGLQKWPGDLELRDQEHLVSHSVEVARYTNQAKDKHREGKYKEGNWLAAKAVEVAAARLGPEHPIGATALNICASLLRAVMLSADALPLFRRALRIRERLQGSGPLSSGAVASVRNNLGGCLLELGHHAEAYEQFRQAVSTWEGIYGDSHPEVAKALNNCAVCLKRLGRQEEAEAAYWRCLSMKERCLGAHHFTVATTLNNLAALLADMGRCAEAEPLHRRSVIILERELGPRHPSVANALQNLAEVMRLQSKYSEAEPLFEAALAILEPSLGPDHPCVLNGLENLNQLYRSLCLDDRFEDEAVNYFTPRLERRMAPENRKLHQFRASSNAMREHGRGFSLKTAYPKEHPRPESRATSPTKMSLKLY